MGWRRAEREVEVSGLSGTEKVCGELFSAMKLEVKGQAGSGKSWGDIGFCACCDRK